MWKKLSKQKLSQNVITDQIMTSLMQDEMYTNYQNFYMNCMNGPCSRIRVYNVVHKLQIPVKNDLLSCEQLT